MADIVVRSATPIFFVSDVRRAAAFFRDSLGFEIDFLHADPPFYGAVSRGEACIHLRLVHQTWFAGRSAAEESLILATIEVSDVAGLYAEFQARGVQFLGRDRFPGGRSGRQRLLLRHLRLSFHPRDGVRRSAPATTYGPAANLPQLGRSLASEARSGLATLR
jgi:catechol 2,3-dioxygenase-like lactoylglutathione lyase family enzyme